MSALRFVCPVCAADVGEPCTTAFGGGHHAGRELALNLPTLDDIERGRKLREGIERIGGES